MPKTKITFSFDDGCISTYSNAFPILKENGLLGCLSVVTDRVGVSPDYYNWDQIGEMVAAGWEVLSHTRNHDLWDMTTEKIQKEVVDAKRVLTEHGYPPKVFVAPGGPWQEKQPDLVGPGSEFAKTVCATYDGYMAGGHGDAIKLPLDPHRFPRFGCECYEMEQFNAALVDIKGAIDKAAAEGDWCHLGWHDVQGKHIETFRQTALHAGKYLQEGKLEPATISQALAL